MAPAQDAPMSVSRIVVGDDGSAAAAAARSWAERMATLTAGEITVVRAEVGPGGSAAAGLLARARHETADLIVVGRRGAGGFPKLRLGSTAHQIAEHSSVPVAVVPPIEPAGPHREPLNRIALGLDGSPAAAEAAVWTATLAAATSAVVWAVHAADLGPAFAVAGLDDAAYTRAMRTRSHTLEHKWCAPLRRAGVPHETVLEEGGAATVLIDVVRRHDIDLLVVGRHGVGDSVGPAMGSVAHRVAAFAPCPTVVVPRAAAAREV
jgi:nucleotide-binding universal stress UspA family protein